MAVALLVVIGILIVVLLFRLAADVQRIAASASREAAKGYSPLYAVFSKAEIERQLLLAVDGTRKSQQLERALLDSEKFQPKRPLRIDNETSKQMLEVTRSICESEGRWYLHAVMMDANISALTGRESREAALAQAEEKFKILPLSADVHATPMRDHWKNRLEDQSLPLSDPPPRPYSNVWQARWQKYGWQNLESL
jgi:hypothetical protein